MIDYSLLFKRLPDAVAVYSESDNHVFTTLPWKWNDMEIGYGRIVNLGSLASEVGLPKFSGYSAAKAGVIMMTKVLAMELAQKKITVNSVSPRMIGTSTEPTKYTWIGRWETGTEAANFVLCFASDDSAFITGVGCPVDGGRILGALLTTFENFFPEFSHVSVSNANTIFGVD
jgi:NAD(P)-dependent dehydrogenase (short-subunit alcohol dehydrogenase family)